MGVSVFTGDMGDHRHMRLGCVCAVMAAPQGNRFWEARSSHGRAPIFAKPEDLWTAATEYFCWVDANPLYEAELVKFQGEAKAVEVAKMRAMTLSGLCIFLDIARRTWDDYCKRDDYMPVTEAIAEVIRTQKYEGAAADLLNANIIARDLGLAERQEHSGPGGGPIVTDTTVRPPITREQWLELHAQNGKPVDAE